MDQTHHTFVVFSASAVNMETESLTGKVKFTITLVMLSKGFGPYEDEDRPTLSP